MYKRKLLVVLGLFFSFAGQAAGPMAKGLKFSTYGNDCWLDGTETNAVAAGECYALVWKQNGATFAGLPMVPPNPNDPYALGDDVWLVDYFPVATLDEETGRVRCPEQVVGIGSLPLLETTNGTWTVYLLDTRYRQADGTVACGFDPSVTNAPRRINAYKAVPGLTDFTIGTTLGPAWETKVGGSPDGTPVVTDVATEKTIFGITFDAGEGRTEEVRRDVIAGSQLGELPGATRVGYQFDGWYTAAKGGTKVEATTRVTADVTYYAHWTANTYTVEFNERGGEGEMDDQEMTWDEEEELYRNAFTRKGYAFLGWTSDEQELVEVQYYDGVVVSNLTSEAGGEFDLYAVWAANAYTVTFHANGGEGEMEPQEFLYDEEQTLTANAFTSLDYAFAGWATSEDGDVVYKNGAKVKNLTDEADGNIDLYAVWSGLRSEVVEVGVKTTIKTEEVFGEKLTGYVADGLPTGLKYDAKKGEISGTITKTSEIGAHEVTLEKELDVRKMLIVVPELPKIDVALWSERASDTNGCAISGAGSYQVGKNVTLKVTVPKGSKERATAFLGWYMKVDGEEDAPWPDEKNYTKTSVSYKMTSESVSLVAKVAAETTDDVTVDCSGLRAYGGQITAGVAGSATGIPLDIKTVGDVPPKSVKVTNLPSGMKYDAKTGLITGAPTKAGESKKVTITVTTANGMVKTSEPIELTVVALPDSVVGTFDGFVLNGVGEGCDDCGTLSLTVKADGKLSAKAVTADGTYSFSGACWDAVTGSVYYATMKSKTNTLTLQLDSTAAWNEQQLGGKLTVKVNNNDVVRDVTAQRHAFGQPWYFCATGDEESGWSLAYTNVTKGAPLTVTFKLDGTTTIAGSLKGNSATYKVSAKGYANVSMMTNGAFVADFAPVLKVGSAKKVLSIHTNLWMDRDNKHEADEFGVGTVKFAK